MVAVIVLRELIITSLRSFMETAGAKFGADWLGKLKMVLQCAALLAIFILLLMPREPSPKWTAVYWLTVVLVYGTVIATLAERRAIHLAGRLSVRDGAGDVRDESPWPIQNNDFGFCIVGCGMIARFHARALAEVPGARIAALVSRNLDNAKETGSRPQLLTVRSMPI